MAGMNPAFVANQLGHSVQMLLSVYSRWVSGDQDDIEMGKLLSAPDLPQAPRKPA
jgi:integrase